MPKRKRTDDDDEVQGVSNILLDPPWVGLPLITQRSGQFLNKKRIYV